jgi:hypothetical protein
MLSHRRKKGRIGEDKFLLVLMLNDQFLLFLSTSVRVNGGCFPHGQAAEQEEDR